MVVRAQGWGEGVRHAGEVRGPCGDGTVECLGGAVVCTKTLVIKLQRAAHARSHTHTPAWCSLN